MFPHMWVSIVSMIATHPWHGAGGWWPGTRPSPRVPRSADPGHWDHGSHCNKALMPRPAHKMWAPMHWDLIQNKNCSDTELRFQRPLHWAGQAMAGLTLLLTTRITSSLISVTRVTPCHVMMPPQLMSVVFLIIIDVTPAPAGHPGHWPHLVSPAARPWSPGGCMRWCPPCPCITGSPSVPLSVLSQLILLVHVVSASTDWQPPLLSAHSPHSAPAHSIPL